ncbi:MAG TPA: hypothetical protein VGH51_20590 [Candidatus Angelobacter sp.]
MMEPKDKISLLASTAINSVFSYPNTKALTKEATAFGPLGCP